MSSNQFHLVTGTPLTKRVAEDRDTYKKITRYGDDNLYPQRMKEVMLMSPLTKSAISLLADFYKGDGFTENPVVNRNGEKINDILRLVAKDFALYEGYALHLNSNGLGSVVEITHVPFEYVRLGLADQKGRIRSVEVSNNWELSNSDILPQPTLEKTTKYEIFNPQTNAVEAITTAKGQMFYYTGKKNHYPLATVDAIIESAHSDYELMNFELSNITNGFLSMSIFKYPGGTDAKEEAAALAQKLNQFKGSGGANSIMVAAIDEDFTDGNLVEQIPANNNDTLFVQSTLNTRNRILQHLSIPAGLLGYQPEGSVFTQENLADSYTYMNLRTKDTRNMLGEHFSELGFDVGEITPKQFESSTMLENGNTTTSTPLAN
jgi:hypothetical protein